MDTSNNTISNISLFKSLGADICVLFKMQQALFFITASESLYDNEGMDICQCQCYLSTVTKV
jgi:hypothetical protein